MSKTAFGKRLKELRKAAGLTQAELGERAGGMTWNGIAQLEMGRHGPRWDTVLALCRALGVPCTAFDPTSKKGK